MQRAFLQRLLHFATPRLRHNLTFKHELIIKMKNSFKLLLQIVHSMVLSKNTQILIQQEVYLKQQHEEKHEHNLVLLGAIPRPPLLDEIFLKLLMHIEVSNVMVRF